MNLLGTRLPEYDLALIALSLVVLGALWLLFQRTRWGTLVRAATEDREMVGALGVNQAWLFTGAFFLGSMLAGLGGAAQLPKGGADLLMDFNILAAVFVVVVVGGMGSIAGAFLAAVLISELGAFGILLIPQSTLVLMFAVMAVVLIFRPWGLLGRPEAPGQHGQAGRPNRRSGRPRPGSGQRACSCSRRCLPCRRSRTTSPWCSRSRSRSWRSSRPACTSRWVPEGWSRSGTPPSSAEARTRRPSW